MTEAEAIDLSKQIARKNGWTWIGPGIARRSSWLSRLFNFGRVYWNVRSHSGVGCRVNVVIDDATGAVVNKSFDRR
jgi:hypothetical protein